MRNNLNIAFGRRVTYLKSGNHSRNGWTGTITDVSPRDDRFEVAWDEDGGEVTSYTASAFTGRVVEDKWTSANDRFLNHSYDGYIYLLGSVSEAGEVFIVAGENAGQPQRVLGGREAAEAVARKKAASSRSGQGYLVFRAVTRYKRQSPPVQRDELVKEN